MQELWNIVENQSVFVYFITGISLFGILSRLILQENFRRLVKASENMASATGRQLREIRNHYENSLAVDRQIHNIHAYVDKYLLKLTLCKIPIRLWAGMTIEAAMLSVACGGLGIVNSIHKGYGEEVIFSILFATIISCACLLSMENIFRIENSYDRLQANIEDYLENNLRNRLQRPVLSRQERLRRTPTGDTGRAEPRPADDMAEIPMPAGQALGMQRAIAGQQATGEKEPVALGQVAVGQEEPAASGQETGQEAGNTEAGGAEAELVAQVLRNFFSS